jgi:glycosyltransferase involved in cell wall biosynthesis
LGKKIIKNDEAREITTQDPFFTGLAGLILKRKGKIILEVQLHGDFFGGDYYKKSGLGNLLRYVIARFIVLPRVDKIRAVGQRIKQSLLKIGVPESKIEVRPVYLDKDFIAGFVPKSDLRVKYPEFKKIFLFLGRLEKVKNIPWLVEVFKTLSPKENSYLLLLVGSGGEKEKIEKKIAALGLGNNVRLEDWTNDPLSYLKTADAFVFPSLSEGYGLAVMEAVWSGCPLVMTDVGVANFELQAGEKVRIISIGDGDNFSQALREI